MTHMDRWIDTRMVPVILAHWHLPDGHVVQHNKNHIFSHPIWMQLSVLQKHCPHLGHLRWVSCGQFGNGNAEFPGTVWCFPTCYCWILTARPCPVPWQCQGTADGFCTEDCSPAEAIKAYSKRMRHVCSTGGDRKAQCKACQSPPLQIFGKIGWSRVSLQNLSSGWSGFLY